MATRQAQIPGGAYVNETRTKQQQVPGWQYANETASGGGTQTFSYTASGGLTFAGASSELRKAIPSPAGGLTFAGTSAQARVAARTASGGLTFGGAAATAFHVAARIVTAAGGILFGGTSTVSFVGGTGGTSSHGGRRMRYSRRHVWA